MSGVKVSRAEPEEPRLARVEQTPAYRVIKVEGQTIYVDAKETQVRPHQVLDLVRKESVADPSTGEPIEGRVRLGTIRILRIGDRFSIAIAPAGVEARVGDLAVFRKPEPRAAEPSSRPARRATHNGRALTRRPQVNGGLRLRAPMPHPAGSYKSSDQQRRERLLAANFGTTNRLAVGGRYVSYGSRDRFGQFVGEYTHYFLHRVVHSLRFGGGGLLGETPLPVYSDDPTQPQAMDRETVRFYYGLAGLDLSMTEWLGMDLMAVFGVTLDGVGGGAMGAMRIGKRDGVNVRIGGWLRSYVGHEGFLALEVPIGERLKLVPKVVIDNMPRGEDTGFRAVMRAEYRLGRHFGLNAELGGAARDAHNGGLVGSLGVSAHL
jgi:hypothetical protein